MPKYSEQDLKYAAELREEIHRDALARVKALYPEADQVIDEYPSEAYFQEVWDYPGKWYTMVGTPPGAGGRKSLTETIVRNTLAYYRNMGAVYTDEAFQRMIAEYPDIVCDYCFVNAGLESGIAGPIPTVLLWNAPPARASGKAGNGLTI